MSAGRPSDYSDELADTICEALSEGQSLRSICEADDMPHRATVFRWLAANEGFRDQYARAREVQADAIFDEMLEIADDAGLQEAFEVQHARLRIDTRKWMAGKLKPRVYGDKLELTGDPERPLVTKVVREVFRPHAVDTDR